MHLKQSGFTYSASGSFTKHKSLKKQEIQKIFTEVNYINLVSNLIWLIETLKS